MPLAMLQVGWQILAVGIVRSLQGRCIGLLGSPEWKKCKKIK